MNPIVTRLNESFSYIDADLEVLQEIHNFLKVERDGAYFDPLVKAGFKSPYDFFASIQNKKLLVLNGHLQLLGNFGISEEKQVSDYTELQLDKFLKEIKPKLPFMPHDFQEIAFKESILGVKQINLCSTSSGKSLIISLIAEFFRTNNKKGLLLVPNINLLTQFKGDIKEYLLTDLYADIHIIGGGSTDRHFNNALTISTWQSLVDVPAKLLEELDYVVCDECLHPNTLIKTDFGEIKIKDLTIGDNVLTINEKTKELEYNPILKVHKNISNEQMFELITETEEKIYITGNHKVQTSKGWKRVDELTLHDEIIDLQNYK